ncbi:hypothetical protein GW916_06325 [bacterium]|nr:hypothetical protein [bacterium]
MRPTQFLVFGVLILSLQPWPVSAMNLSQNFNFDGVLVDGSNIPMTGPVSIKFQIYEHGGTEDCLLFEETHSSVTLDSSGHFTVKIGSGTRASASADGGLEFKSVFQNDAQVRPSGTNCSSGYTPSAGHSRSLKVTVNSTPLSPLYTLSPTPMALVAETLQGKTTSDFVSRTELATQTMKGPLKLLDSGFTNGVSIQAPSSTAGYVLTLPNDDGSSGQVLSTDGSGVLSWQTAGSTLNGQSLPGLSAGESFSWNGSTWDAITPLTSETDPNVSAFAKATLPTCSAGEVLKADGTNLSCVTDANGGAATDATDSVKGIANFPTAGGLSISSGSVSLPDVATAGTSTKVTFDAKGRIISGTTLAEADIPTLSTAGKVSGSAITSGTIAGSTAVNTSGNITTTGSIDATGSITSASSSMRQIDLYDSDNSNKITLVTPATGTLTSNYTLRLPANDGSSGNVLTTNGLGDLSWSAPVGGSGDFLKDGSLDMTGPFKAVPGSATTPGISFGGDTNTGIFGTGSGTLAFSVDSTEAMRIDATSNVGIGTAFPTTKLHVEGVLRLGLDSSETCSGIGDKGKIRFTDTPYRLQFCDGGAWSNFMIENPSTTFIEEGGQTGPLWIGSSDPENVTFGTDGTDRMVIDQNGLVTLNKGSTDEVLRISSLSGSVTARMITTSSVPNETNKIYGFRKRPSGVLAGDSLFRISGHSDGTSGGGAYQAAAIEFLADTNAYLNHVPGRIAFNVTDTTGANLTAMTIINNGNVGLGTITPMAKLHVAGDLLGGFWDNSSNTSIIFSKGNLQTANACATFSIDGVQDGGVYRLVVLDSQTPGSCGFIGGGGRAFHYKGNALNIQSGPNPTEFVFTVFPGKILVNVISYNGA